MQDTKETHPHGSIAFVAAHLEQTQKTNTDPKRCKQTKSRAMVYLISNSASSLKFDHISLRQNFNSSHGDHFHGQKRFRKRGVKSGGYLFRARPPKPKLPRALFLNTYFRKICPNICLNNISRKNDVRILETPMFDNNLEAISFLNTYV